MVVAWLRLVIITLNGFSFRYFSRGRFSRSRPLSWTLLWCFHGTIVVVKTKILDVGDKKIRFVHKMYECLSGDEASTCETTGVHIDRTLRRSTPFPEHIRQKALEWGEARS